MPPVPARSARVAPIKSVAPSADPIMKSRTTPLNTVVQVRPPSTDFSRPFPSPTEPVSLSDFDCASQSTFSSRGSTRSFLVELRGGNDREVARLHVAPASVDLRIPVP